MERGGTRLQRLHSDGHYRVQVVDGTVCGQRLSKAAALLVGPFTAAGLSGVFPLLVLGAPFPNGDGVFPFCGDGKESEGRMNHSVGEHTPFNTTLPTGARTHWQRQH